MAYTVIRTDAMSGTHAPEDLFSVRFYDGADEFAAAENGLIVELKGLEDGEREVHKAVAATAVSNIEDCVILAAPEVMYDERKVNLDEFINEAGKATRGYALRTRNVFSVTKEAFVGGTVPAKDAEVGIGVGGKIDAAGTGLGVCKAIEKAGRYTYYVIGIKY